MARPALVINPLSHTVKKHGSILANCAEMATIPAAFLDPFYTIGDVIADAAKADCNQLFIEGGDGTIHGVLTALMQARGKFKTLPDIILLPGGMTNIIAKQVGLKKPNPKAIRKIVEGKAKTQEHSMPMLKVQPVDQAPHYGFLLSTGALPRGTKYCKAEIHQRGLEGSLAIITTIAKVLLTDKTLRSKILQPTKLNLTVNDTHLSQDHFLCIASTLPGSLSGLHPFWGKGDGSVRMSYASADAKRIVRNVIAMTRKQKPRRIINRFQSDGFQSWNTDEAVLTHNGDVVLDGEFLPATEQPIHLSATLPLTFLS